MKIIIVTLTALLLVTSSFAAHKNKTIVPAEAEKSFLQKYPGVHVKKWEVRHDTCIAMFKASKRTHYAYYLAKGGWIKTSTKILFTSGLPRPVDSKWKQCEYRTWSVEAIEKVELPERSLFSIQVYRDFRPQGSMPGDGVERHVLYFKPDGELLKDERLQ
jgi:hypothetical protein